MCNKYQYNNVHKFDYEIGNDINGAEYKENEHVYNLIKKTWIGQIINGLATLSEVLGKKKKEAEIDLSELLV